MLIMILKNLGTFIKPIQGISTVRILNPFPELYYQMLLYLIRVSNRKMAPRTTQTTQPSRCHISPGYTSHTMQCFQSSFTWESKHQSPNSPHNRSLILSQFSLPQGLVCSVTSSLPFSDFSWMWRQSHINAMTARERQVSDYLQEKARSSGLTSRQPLRPLYESQGVSWPQLVLQRNRWFGILPGAEKVFCGRISGLNGNFLVYIPSCLISLCVSSLTTSVV
jgi:hypothetical protein